MKLKNAILLFLAATVWGLAFSAQSLAVEHVGPFTVNCIRCFIGAIFLIPCIALLDKFGITAPDTKEKGATSTLLIGGCACGFLLAIASSLQQIGIMNTSVGKAGFITTFYIILVPIIGLFFKKTCGLNVWIGTIIALVGLYFLCFTAELSFNLADFIVFCCALVFSFHILVIDHFSPLVNGVKLSCIQFFVAGILCSIPMFLYEKPSMLAILAAGKPILYLGVMSCGVGYTLQIVGQKDANPTIASLILSLESVVSAIGGAVILHQKLSTRELLGCALMFAAIILAQLPGKTKE